VIFSQRVRWPDVHLLKQVKRIYLDSFDKMDRVPFFLLILGILIGKLKLIAAFRRQLAGFALWLRLPVPASGTAYLAYLAVGEQQRCLGIGGELFQAVVAEAVENANKTLVWEVEIPEGDSDSPRRRRVVFYTTDRHHEANAYYVAASDRSITS
jgi:ribosomal protein S18 acetylase RimI-like enzyme